MRLSIIPVFLTLFSILLPGCGLMKSGNSAGTSQADSKKQWVSLDARTPDTSITDRLADNPFEMGEDPLKQVSQLERIQHIDTTLQENMHVEGQTDTIFTFHFPASELHIYKAQDRSFLFHARLMDPEIGLNRNIHLGMTRSEFQEIFPQLPPQAGYIRIQSEIVEQHVDFYFQKNLLTQVEYQGYLD